MAGIHGLNFSRQAFQEVQNIYNLSDWAEWAIFHIDTENTVLPNAAALSNTAVLDLSGIGLKWDDDTPQDTWEQFVHTLPKLECRYGLCNFEHMGSDNILRSKIIFVMWAPNEAPVKQRLQTAMHMHDIKKQINTVGGITLTVQANDVSDLSYDTVLKKLQSVCYVF